MKFNVGFGCALVCALLGGCKGDQTASSGGDPKATGKPALTKLVSEDTKVGTGAAAAVGDTVVMQYRGALGDGSQFDSNVPADPDKPDKAPFSFKLVNGRASVIDGWNLGIVGMKVGGERKLSIPWTLAYGPDGKPPVIPPKADLYFDVKLLGIVRAGHENEFGVTDLKRGTGPAVKDGDWVTVTYTAKLLNNFPVEDSTKLDTGTLQFQTPSGDMGGGEYDPIKGVVVGVKGMQVGGERVLTCPPLLATNPMIHDPKLPPDNVIRFDVKLLRVSNKKEANMEAPKS